MGGTKSARAYQDMASTQVVTLANAVAIASAATQTVPSASGVGGLTGSKEAIFQATFAYGSGGTTCKAFVQTPCDVGATWVDVVAFAFTTASAKKISKVSIGIALTPAYVPTDGTLTDDTIKDGLLGAAWRVKIISTGTYAGGTTVSVTATFKG